MADLSPSLAANPDPSSWITPAAGRTIHVRTGKVELGQGVLTALAQIVADGLRLPIECVRMIAASTDGSPDEGYTAGSLSIQHSGAALRTVAAAWHAGLVLAAASAFGVDAGSLRVVDGAVTSADGRTLTYWDLPPDAVPAVGAAAPSAAGVVGTSVGRLDIPGRVFGTRRYLQDVRLPGQLFGRVVRPPSRGARLLNLDETRVRALPGVVEVVRDGDFVGLVAEREDVAVRAIDLLDCTWKRESSLPDQHELAAYLRAAPAERIAQVERGTEAAGPPAVEASFSRPYLAHGSIGTACAIAEWQAGQLRVWSHSQGIYQLRAELARWFEVSPDRVTVTHVEGAGCYGHNGADDVAGDAALLAAAVPGRPVHVAWSRQDELGWAPFGPAMAVTVRVTVDDAGQPTHWAQEIWSNGHSGRPSSAGNPPLLAAIHQAGDADPVPSTEPPLNRGGGSARNAVPGYRVPNLHVVTNRLLEMPLRTSALRSLGAHLNVYAIEAVMDQLAADAGADPVAYRLALLDDPRGRAVIEAAATAAGWGSSGGGADAGRGFGYARYKNASAYCAVVADVEVTSRVAVTRLTLAVDVGLTVNPDGVRNQIEGGAIQALSWTTKEQVRFDAHDVTSRTWEGYPIVTFADVPPIETVIVDRPDLPSLGAGEASLGPTAAAIGNAVRDALGARIHDLPLTAENLMRSL